MTTIEHEYSVEEEEQARDFLNALSKPVNIVDKLDRKHESLFKKMMNVAYPWSSREYSHVDRFRLTKKMQVLSFDINDIVKNLKFSTRQVSKNDEFFLKRVNMDWEPHISKGSPGQTSLILCDFRCKKFENIFKGGYVFNTSESIQGLCCSPGYMISLQDPNLHKIFKFMVITAGLDLDEDSFYGRLTLGLDFTVGSSLKSASATSSGLTLVTNKKATPVGGRIAGPLDDITGEISIEEVVQTLRDVNFNTSERSSKLQITPEQLNSFLNRSLSLSHSKGSLEIREPYRHSVSGFAAVQVGGERKEKNGEERERKKNEGEEGKLKEVLKENEGFKAEEQVGISHPFPKFKPRTAIATVIAEKVEAECSSKPHLFTDCKNYKEHLASLK